MRGFGQCNTSADQGALETQCSASAGFSCALQCAVQASAASPLHCQCNSAAQCSLLACTPVLVLSAALHWQGRFQCKHCPLVQALGSGTAVQQYGSAAL